MQFRSKGEERRVDGEAGGTEANGWRHGRPQDACPSAQKDLSLPPRLLLEVKHLHQHFFCIAPPR